MSNQVAHIVCEVGRKYNEALHPSFRASDSELQILQETGSLWDGRFIEDPLEFSVELTGIITISWLPINYSCFLSDDNERSKVHLWERTLVKLFPRARRVRIDEFLLGLWETKADDFWFRDISAVTSFFEWLEGQSKEGWKNI